MQIRFAIPAETRRPGKSHRYDVFGPKIGRSLTFFHPRALDRWIDLERDPAVTWYCERPVRINDGKFKRLVDFYAIRQEKEELSFILKPGEDPDCSPQELFGPGFVQWCHQSEIAVHLVDSEPASSNRQIMTNNWGHVLRELSAFGRYVPTQLTDSVLLELSKPRTLDELQLHYPKVDPILLKVASFSLLHRGLASCAGIEQQPFSSSLPFSAL
ncbi:hypothetical protein [Massilia soli]|uniref:TnsA endonuclease N-terminal domain-containing protein n=1 Tax=Massilia soli TaxID=2792854 RepID=A0ABS7SV28_9BURK|nr:hypothetical protein [Massilia soli]MBZ2209813.1 hypothetical protein [Massilia soli]